MLIEIISKEDYSLYGSVCIRQEGRGCALLPHFGGGSLLPDVLTRQPSRR